MDRNRRDPVAPARASEPVRLEKQTHLTRYRLPVQRFRTLLARLGARCRNTCGVTGAPKVATFHQVKDADGWHAEALRLIEMEPETKTGH